MTQKILSFWLKGILQNIESEVIKLNGNIKNKNEYKIPIKINSYEDLFVEFDYRNVEDRSINKELDEWIKEYILRIPHKLKDINIELEINMPIEMKDEKKEETSKISLLNSYKDFLKREEKLSFMGVRRIIYYMIVAATLLSLWYFIKTNKGESLLTSLLNSGGTVLMWEVMSLIFIQGKNFNYTFRMNKKLSNMNIVFKYI